MQDNAPSSTSLPQAVYGALAPLKAFNLLVADMDPQALGIDPREIGVVGDALLRLAARDLDNLFAVIHRDRGNIFIERKRRENDLDIFDLEYTQVEGVCHG
ncbi:MAG: hypothetical protein AAGU21_10390 [Solidesulfovibrio sp.]|uniref:hypothetical protein n=1 Tax=Solidesulfovibrio sp. TaxID=2910990 RepID=UPI002B216D07|nr:hypothetical protein [Solidesulfovibrio sp.]MEA4855210.1 hypothetical protein [Solidesulfovibrio sp.]